MSKAVQQKCCNDCKYLTGLIFSCPQLEAYGQRDMVAEIISSHFSVGIDIAHDIARFWKNNRTKSNACPAFEWEDSNADKD